ncbi:MAG TPA: hypothetical protein PK156_09540 [Polyangium sp.]|nr:hypothetical protein [Polyangium sp.]
MSYADLYHSPWHNPGLFIVTNGLLLVFLVLRKPAQPEAVFLRNTSLVLAILAIADACLTAELAPFSGATLLYVCIPFVILGDVRFFFLLERYARKSGGSAPWTHLFLRSLGWGLIVPATAYATKMAFYPERTIAWLFLTYESFFIVLALVFNTLVLPRWMNAWNISAAHKRWIRGIGWLEFAFYALWALADVVILSGHDGGYLLRLVPNIMYYAVFGWFVILSAPEDLRS